FRFDILAFCSGLVETAARESACVTTMHSAEKLFEKVTESGSPKLKGFTGFVGVSARAASESAARRRRTILPLGAKSIVFFAFFGIAQNFVGLVDLLELFLGLRLVLRHIGM